MIILGGALLLAPGFITDVIGFALLIPPTRALAPRRSSRGSLAAGWRLLAPSSGRRPAPRPRPGAERPARPRRGYDYEGTAHEVTEPAGDRAR